MELKFEGIGVLKHGGVTVVSFQGEKSLSFHIPGEDMVLLDEALMETGLTMVGRDLHFTQPIIIWIEANGDTGSVYVKLASQNLLADVVRLYNDDPEMKSKWAEAWDKLSSALDELPEDGAIRGLFDLLTKVDWSGVAQEAVYVLKKHYPAALERAKEMLDPKSRDMLEAFEMMADATIKLQKLFD